MLYNLVKLVVIGFVIADVSASESQVETEAQKHSHRHKGLIDKKLTLINDTEAPAKNSTVVALQKDTS